MLYHWIIGVIGIALFLWVWAWSQARAIYKDCEDMTEGALCIKGTDCQPCMREARAKIDCRDGEGIRVCLEVNDQIEPRS